MTLPQTAFVLDLDGTLVDSAYQHVLAWREALAAGIKTVMLPRRNQRDLEDVPAEARDKLTFVWMERVDDAITAALTPQSR